jgi:ubiquinone/menaquinone biosynthesis C-methylase UbiE
MNEEEAQRLASQLRKPEGEMGLQVGERMNEGNKFMNLHTIAQLNLQPHEHIVEIGMGNGFFVQELFKKQPLIIYTGCDFSELMVQESIKNNQEWIDKNQARFFHAPAHDLPFIDESIDKIFTINTLYFWENPSQVINECHRILMPQGKLLICFRPKKYMQHFPFTQYGFHMYSQEEAIELFATPGWQVVEVVEKKDPPINWYGEQLEPESLILVVQKK